MQDRRELLESGEARFWRLFRRPVDDGERVTLSPPVVNVTTPRPRSGMASSRRRIEARASSGSPTAVR
jgi:hypothetical protein